MADKPELDYDEHLLLGVLFGRLKTSPGKLFCQVCIETLKPPLVLDVTDPDVTEPSSSLKESKERSQNHQSNE
jgi:hypothetical protein